MTDTLLVIHAAATWFLVGLSWTIRVVHYPLFAQAAADFRSFHRRHTSRITTLLAVPWSLEGLTALALPFILTGPDRALSIVGLVAVAAIAGVTLLAAVPTHGRLATGFDDSVHRRLLEIDSVRVVLWTGRGLVASVLLLG